MRSVVAVSLWIVVAVAAGCGDPCEKSLEKMQKCWKMNADKGVLMQNVAQEVIKRDAPIFMQVCKAERSKFKKCSKLTDCGEFSKCISEAATDPRAVEILKRAGEQAAEGDMTAAPADMPAEADMTAAPADMPAEADMTAAPADMPAEADMTAAPADMPAVPADMK